MAGTFRFPAPVSGETAASLGEPRVIAGKEFFFLKPRLTAINRNWLAGQKDGSEVCKLSKSGVFDAPNTRRYHDFVGCPLFPAFFGGKERLFPGGFHSL
jgi:hypothetical protein